MKDRIRSLHVHDNDGEKDSHLFPLIAEGGTIDWKQTMSRCCVSARTSIRCFWN